MNAPVKPMRVSGVFALPDFTVPNRDATRFIIPIRFLTAPIDVVIPRSPNFNDGDEIEILMDGVAVGATYTIPNITDPDYRVPIAVADFPANGLDRTVILNYRYRDTFNLTEEDTVLNLPVRFDRLRPGANTLGPIDLTEDQRTGITAADFNGSGELPLAITPYLRIELEDTVQVWIGPDRDNQATGTWLPAMTPVTDKDNEIIVNVPRAALDALGDGERYFAYRVFDWAGNESVWANRVGTTVTLQGPALLAPVVPEFVNDGLIVWPEANPNVEVEIPAYANGAAAAGDVIQLRWGAQDLPPYTLTAADISNNPLTTILVPLAIVQQTGNGQVVVNYEMRRTNLPGARSPDANVQVDLSTPGGIDPNPGTPEHENLVAPSVQCGASPVNSITPPDFGLDATATIPRVGVDGTVIWANGDVVQVHWQSISNPQIGPVTVTVGNGAANLPVPIPFIGVIDQTQTGEFDVWYTVTRQLTPTPPPVMPAVGVTSISPIQRVRVTSPNALPGGATGLAMGVFPHANANNIIVPRLISPGVYDRDTVFRIPLAGVPNVAAGDTLTYRFVGHRVPARPRPPISLTPPNPLDPEIPESLVETPAGTAITLTPQDLSLGYHEVALPYLDLTDWICSNGATLNYSLTNSAGTVVAPARYTFFAVNPAGQACRI